MPAGQPQRPPSQIWSVRQVTPQAPQLVRSLTNTLVHLPLQSSRPGAQMHEPRTQFRPAPHTTPQPPQFCGSLKVEMQPCPQSAKFSLQACRTFTHLPEDGSQVDPFLQDL